MDEKVEEIKEEPIENDLFGLAGFPPSEEEIEEVISSLL